MAQQRVKTDTLKAIIEESNRDSLITYAKQIGDRAARADLGTSQVRNIYGMVKQLQTQTQAREDADLSRLKLLIPKLHYAAAKQSALKELAAVLAAAVNMVITQDPETTKTRFRNFTDFFEAIVAYHYARSKGGK